MLSVFILSVVMLSVVAPIKIYQFEICIKNFFHYFLSLSPGASSYDCAHWAGVGHGILTERECSVHVTS